MTHNVVKALSKHWSVFTLRGVFPKLNLMSFVDKRLKHVRQICVYQKTGRGHCVKLPMYTVTYCRQMQTKRLVFQDFRVTVHTSLNSSERWKGTHTHAHTKPRVLTHIHFLKHTQLPTLHYITDKHTHRGALSAAPHVTKSCSPFSLLRLQWQPEKLWDSSCTHVHVRPGNTHTSHRFWQFPSRVTRNLWA